MKRLLALAICAAAGIEARADTLVLKDGTSIEWRVLKDNGDTLEVQTVDNRTVTVAKKDVKEIRISAPKAPLTGATFTGDTTRAGAPVNVLALVDPRKHTGGGECRAAAGAVVCSGAGLLELPHVPVGAYDVEVLIERRDGEDECHIGLVAAGRPFSVQVDWGKGQCTGLSGVDGKQVYENETRVNGRQLLPKKARTFVCAVRDDQVVVLADGKEILRWKGDPKRLSLGSRSDKLQNLFFSWNGASFALLKYTVTPRKE
jgi:hypothetical protein